jgi:lipid-binding SYLF domain-containing protein
MVDIGNTTRAGQASGGKGNQMVAKTCSIEILVVFGLLIGVAAAQTLDVTKDVKEAQETIAVFKKADPALSRFFDNAVGYAVFPTVVKGAVGVGGARGSGIVFEKGKAVGKASLTQATLGAQLGGQTYSEVIFFETVPAFTDFTKGALALAAQVSAVAASADASKNVNYQDGVAVFTIGKGGLMAEASVGGQKFTFEPFARK